jgi:hypothetical protein
MFSPDFKSFIDVDYKQEQFLIRRTDEEQNIIYRVPVGLYNTNSETGENSRRSSRHMASRM